MSKAILRTKQLSKQFGKIHVVKNHDGDYGAYTYFSRSA